jgi:hypothetical protein
VERIPNARSSLQERRRVRRLAKERIDINVILSQHSDKHYE